MPGKAAAQQLFYYIRPPGQDARGGDPYANSLQSIQAWEGCCAATILLYPAPLDRMLGEGILVLVLYNEFRPGKAATQQLWQLDFVRNTSYTWLGCCAATILLYPAPLDRMLGEGIQMLVLYNKFRTAWEGCCAATILIHLAPT